MLNFTNNDKDFINNKYKDFLHNLKKYLQSNDRNALIYSKIIINMLHKGYFSMDKVIVFENNYNYIDLPSNISNGVHVMYGICCCRHATEFLNDFLHIMGFETTLIYVLTDNNVWQKVEPTRANHITILLNDKDYEYMIDPVNKFICQIKSNGDLISLDIKSLDNVLEYNDSSIKDIGKILKKYYTYKSLGIDHVYN